TKSELRKVRTLACTTRAAAAHPKRPSNAKVTTIEVTGGTFRGSSARTVRSRKSQGSERNKSMKNVARRSQIPPKYAPNPPRIAESTVESNAAAGANNNEIRIP